METYTLDTLTVGTKHGFDVRITTQMLDAFTEITGDRNPLHVDARYAAERGHPDRVVYGMLTAAFYSTLVGMYLPGKNALLQEVETSFRRPVFVGDTLRIEGEVVEVNAGLKRIEIKAAILNQEGKKVSRARIKAGVYDG